MMHFEIEKDTLVNFKLIHYNESARNKCNASPLSLSLSLTKFQYDMIIFLLFFIFNWIWYSYRKDYLEFAWRSHSKRDKLNKNDHASGLKTRIQSTMMIFLYEFNFLERLVIIFYAWNNFFTIIATDKAIKFFKKVFYFTIRS